MYQHYQVLYNVLVPRTAGNTLPVEVPTITVPGILYWDQRTKKEDVKGWCVVTSGSNWYGTSSTCYEFIFWHSGMT